MVCSYFVTTVRPGLPGTASCPRRCSGPHPANTCLPACRAPAACGLRGAPPGAAAPIARLQVSPKARTAGRGPLILAVAAKADADTSGPGLAVPRLGRPRPPAICLDRSVRNTAIITS